MCQSQIENLTSNASNPEQEILIKPSDTAEQGGAGNQFTNVDTEDTISANTVCKYFNLRLELGANVDSTKQGWYEYAIVLRTDQDTSPLIGVELNDVNTGSLAKQVVGRYRNKVLWNGAVPINQNQTKVLDIALKIPDKWCKWMRGQYLVLIHYYRGTDTTDTTSVMDVVWTSQWKAYL